MIEVGAQVRTDDGQVGTVESIRDGIARVRFGGRVTAIAIEDLQALDADPRAALLAGQFGSPAAYSLRLQSLFLRHAYRYDPGSGLSNARIEPQLHQVFVADRVLQKLRPRMILADEVGLGKTIEAGLIIKELRARKLISRTLIVSPASLMFQWQRELDSKFNERFEVLTRAGAEHLSKGGTRNPFAETENIICSLPFAIRRREQILEADWDLVVFDEAHRVRRTKANTTQAYQLAADISDRVFGLLLLSATPMQLHPYELYSAIDLVEPGLFGSELQYDLERRHLPQLNDLMRSLKHWNTLSSNERTDVLQVHGPRLQELGALLPGDLDDDASRERFMDELAEQHPLAGVMVRNRKAELNLGTERIPKRVMVDLSAAEANLYVEVEEYLRFGYGLAAQTANNPLGFLMTSYHRMLASSTQALRRSLERRIAALQKQHSHFAKAKAVIVEDLGDLEDNLESTDQLADLERLAQLRENEIDILNGLVQSIDRLPLDSKAESFRKAIAEIFVNQPNAKVVVFTQFIETQKYLTGLVEALPHPDGGRLKVAMFNGTMNPMEKENQIDRFRRRHHVLISTESGGEGRNLQFSNILINYDLPWNPMKVEQRIGRIDRIGQKRPVYIYNLACVATIEERVLELLEQRIRLFTESVGALEPILGEVEKELERIVRLDAHAYAIEVNRFGTDLDRDIRSAREQERVLADYALDRASLRRDKAMELLRGSKMAGHKELREFTEGALSRAGSQLIDHPDGGQELVLSKDYVRLLGKNSKTVRGVFDPETALHLEDLPLFAFGHPIIDAILEDSEKTGPVCTAYESPETGGTWVEFIYEYRADPVTGTFRSMRGALGMFVRHRVGPSLVVEANQLTAWPTTARRARATVIPDWAAMAAVASEQQSDSELATFRRTTLDTWEQTRTEERRRLERVTTNQRQRINDQIALEAAQISKLEAEGDDGRQRILPAIRGRLRKSEERLAQVEIALSESLSELLRAKPSVSAELVAVAVVVGTST